MWMERKKKKERKKERKKKERRRKKKTERKKKNNAKFNGYYVHQCTHNLCAHALRSDKLMFNQTFSFSSTVVLNLLTNLRSNCATVNTQEDDYILE